MEWYQYHILYCVKLCEGTWKEDYQGYNCVKEELGKYFKSFFPTYTIGKAFYITTHKNFDVFYDEMINKFNDLCAEANSNFGTKDFCTFEYDICPKLPNEYAIYCINREIKYFE